MNDDHIIVTRSFVSRPGYTGLANRDTGAADFIVREAHDERVSAHGPFTTARCAADCITPPRFPKVTMVIFRAFGRFPIV